MADEITKNEPLHIFMRRPEVLEKFIGLFPDDKQANRFIQSVLILVQSADPGDYSLANCSNESVLRSALRAAALRVSVDPAVRQAWLVPRKNRKTGKIEANLQLHYIELQNRAMRTNRYRTINVSPVYEDETVLQDIYSGLHRVQLKNGLITIPGDLNGFVPVNERAGKYKGWLGYSKTVRGAEQTVYMSVDDIEKFVAQHNPYWTTSKAWKENRKVMEQKTVLLALLRKADLGDPAMEEVREIVNEIDPHEDETVDAEIMSDTNATSGSAVSGDAGSGKPVDPGWDAAKFAHEQEQKKKAAEPVEITRPYPPDVFKVKFDELVKAVEKSNHLHGVGEREQRIVPSAIDGIFAGEKTMRYEFTNWLTGHGSTKDLSKAQLKALMSVMGITDFNQAPSAQSMAEIKQAHSAALIAAGQGTLL